MTSRGAGGRGGLAAAALACALALLGSLGFGASARAEEPPQAVWQLVVEGPAAPALPADSSALHHGDGVTSPLLVVPLGPDGRFGIGYRHSVERTPVIEWFRVGPGSDGDGPRITLTATEYRSFGAGLPTDAPSGARFRRLGDRFLIEGLHVPVPSLVVRPLALSEHELIVGESRWALSGLAPDGAALRVVVQPRAEEGGVP